MADQPDPPNPAELAELAETLAGIAEKSQNLIGEFLKQQNPFTAMQPGQPGEQEDKSDPLNLAGAFIEMTSRLISDPAAVARAQASLWQGYMALWQNMSERAAGGAPDPVAAPARDDRRFRDPEWTENPLFDFIKQSYLLTSRWLVDTVRDITGLAAATAPLQICGVRDTRSI